MTLSGDLVRRLRNYCSVFVLFVAAYAISLIIFVPDSYVEDKVQSVLGSKASWESMHNVNGTWQIRDFRAKAYPELIFPLVEIEPNWLSLLLGKVSADFEGSVGQLRINGIANKSLAGVVLRLSLKAEQLNDQQLSRWPELGTLESASLNGDASLEIDNQGEIKDGDFKLHWYGVSVQGLTFSRIDMNGEWQDDHFNLNASTAGDLQITLLGGLVTTLSPKPTATINAKVNIVASPELPLIKEILGAQQLQLQLKGKVSNVQASCTNKKQCPKWVKLI